MLMLMSFSSTPIFHGAAALAESMMLVSFGSAGNARWMAHSPPFAKSAAGGITSKTGLVRRQSLDIGDVELRGLLATQGVERRAGTRPWTGPTREGRPPPARRFAGHAARPDRRSASGTEPGWTRWTSASRIRLWACRGTLPPRPGICMAARRDGSREFRGADRLARLRRWRC